MTAMINARSTSPTLGDRLSEKLNTLRAAWAAHLMMRRTRDELSALSDRELADLGIARADIAAIARQSVTHRA